MLTIAENDINDDRSLLSSAELRTAVGLLSTDTSADALLTPLGQRVSAVITKACCVASARAIPPTLRLEPVTDTYRLNYVQNSLVLSRKPVVTITSVVENGATLTEDVDYETHAASGILKRLSGDTETTWPSGKIVVAYEAGWEEVPDDLKRIAAELVSAYYLDAGSDPMEKSLSIPDLISTERWVDSSADGELPQEFMDALIRGGYVNRWFVF